MLCGVAVAGSTVPRWVPSSSMVAWAGRKHAGAPCPAPGATVTSRSSRSAIAGTSSVSAADRASHPGAVVAGLGMVTGVVGSAIRCAVIAGCVLSGQVTGRAWCGLDEAGTQGQRGDGSAEGVTHDGGDGGTVGFRRGAHEVPSGGHRPQYGGDLLERDQLPQLRCPPDLTRLQAGGEVAGHPHCAAVDLELSREVII